MERITPRNPRYLAVLALVASLILVVGWLVRPRDVPQSPAPVPSEIEIQQLAHRAERRSLEGMTKYFADIAGEVRTSLTRVSRKALTGIVWNADTIVSAAMTDLDRASAVPVRTSSSEAETIPRLWGTDLPLTALAVPRGLTGLSAAPRASALPQPGEWVVAVWRTDSDTAFEPASFHQRSATRCGDWAARELLTSLSLTRAMAGGGLFNIDGALLGVILTCGDRLAVFDTTTIDEVLQRAATPEWEVISRFGVRVAALDAASQPSFTATEGVLVREVWTGSPADNAGLWPGDVITGIDAGPVATVDDLRPVTGATTRPHSLSVRRGPRTLTLSIGDKTPASPGPPRGAGVVVESRPETYRIDSVLPDSRAARAGIRPGDRVVRIDRQRLRTVAELQRRLSARTSRPMLVEVERGDRRIALVVP